jgi:hypothetical protein
MNINLKQWKWKTREYTWAQNGGREIFVEVELRGVYGPYY